jgi:hypothetical protein
MSIGVFLMLLQAIATFFKDIAKARGKRSINELRTDCDFDFYLDDAHASNRAARFRRHRRCGDVVCLAFVGQGGGGDALQCGICPAELVSAVDAASVYLHGVHVFRVGYRQRPVPHVSCLDGTDPRRFGHRHHGTDGCRIRHERVECCRHGHRCQPGSAGNVETQV